VAKAAQHLLELVNDVLDLSKIEAGRIELHVESVRFPSVIEDLFVSVRPLADENGVELSVKHEGEPYGISTDPRRVRQIVLNLLSNAIKFGNGKPVEVCTARQPDGGVEVLVRDQGIGIAKENLTRIFEEFVQITRKDEQGTGLGLPISRRLAELLGGSLSVESELEKGSTFRLLLPNAVKPGTIEIAPEGGLGRARASSEKADTMGQQRSDQHEVKTSRRNPTPESWVV
jgi:signal transduction histidine kinase